MSTRVGVSKFTYFLLVGLGILLGINAAGVDVTTLNVLTGAIGIGLGSACSRSPATSSAASCC